MTNGKQQNQDKVVPAMLLNWLIPGAGHWYLGERTRGVIFFVAVTFTFWTGLLIGGALSTVNLQTNTAWFFGQVFAGGYTIASLTISRLPGATASYGKTLDLATIYTGVAGLLNIFVIFDVLSRTKSPGKAETKA